MIIENSKLQSKQQRTIWLGVTMILWLAYIYLWLPLISLAAWWFGYKTFKYHMITLNGIYGFKNIFFIYLMVILLLGAFLLCWAKLEHFRFKDKSRRVENKPVSNVALASYFKVNESTLDVMQTKKVVIVNFNHKGEMTELLEHSSTLT